MKHVLKTGGVIFVLMITVLWGADNALWEWVGQSWKLIAGLLGIIAGGFYVPGVRVLLYHAFKAAISGPVLKRLVIRALKNYAASTETDVDDEFVKQFIKNTRKVKGIEKK